MGDAMAKYSALGKYLSMLRVDSIALAFSEIETIIESPLPASAYKYPAYWSNERSGTHTWSHVWQAAGWRSENLDLGGGSITFRRDQQSAEAQLANLEPRKKETIYDLLGVLGISTEDWNGSKANPKYCYNWSFGSVFEHYVVCLWHGNMSVEDGQIVLKGNLRKLALELEAVSQDVSAQPTERSRAAPQAARARSTDDAIRSSFNHGLPVSVIVVKGTRRDKATVGGGSSQTEFRSLDSIKWYAHTYDDDNGTFQLVRGIAPLGSLQTLPTLSLDVEEYAGPPDDLQQRAIKVRRGQKKFRDNLLSAYQKTCAVTGCKVEDLLEAAHIRPHSEEPNYRTSNGLLLRADIHTLFDLGLLAIDPQKKVCLAPFLLNSEYKGYQGKELRQPTKVTDMPDFYAMQLRYVAFREKHGLN
ncbi:hypothetical protein LMG26857_01732 [Achromobacter anxifer]|nr:hypothetical protein LMG26857_01732 [Achromobacter anxifer]